MDHSGCRFEDFLDFLQHFGVQGHNRWARGCIHQLFDAIGLSGHHSEQDAPCGSANLSSVSYIRWSKKVGHILRDKMAWPQKMCWHARHQTCPTFWALPFGMQLRWHNGWNRVAGTGCPRLQERSSNKKHSCHKLPVFVWLCRGFDFNLQSKCLGCP